MRDGSDTWEGCHMAMLLSEHGYVLEPLQKPRAQA
jgi:hypothetical protein